MDSRRNNSIIETKDFVEKQKHQEIMIKMKTLLKYYYGF